MHTYTWDKLAKNAARLNPQTRGANYPTVPKWEQELILPYVGTKTVLIKLKAWGLTQNNIHNVTLLFNDCDILIGEQDVSLYDYFKVTYKKQIYYVKKLNKYTQPLTSRCTCQSEFFDFAWYKYYKGNCLYGPAPKPYRRKTSNYPKRNPQGIIGCCKHVYHSWEFLKNQGLTVN